LLWKKTKPSGSAGREPVIHQQGRRQLFLIGGTLAVIAVILGGFFIINLLTNRPNTNRLVKVVPADQVIVQQVTGVSPSTVQAVGTGGVPNPLKSTQGQPVLQGPYGHPEFLYVGSQPCPYCAAERWAMLNALSRFGSFRNLGQMQTYEENISTFSFYQSTYSSQYVDFVPVEVLSNTLDSSGQNYVKLQTLTAEQQQVFKTYDGPPYFQDAGSYPFIAMGNQYLAQGASYDVAILQDSSQQNSLSWQTIANALSDPQSPITRAIIGTANYLTAAICNLTNQQPGAVCNVSAIQQIEQSLGKP